MPFWLPHMQPLILLCHDYYNLYGMHSRDVDFIDFWYGA